MFNNNYDRNRINKFNNFNESPDNKLKYKIDNNFDLKQQSKNKFFGNLNLFNQSHSNDIINRKLPEQNSPYNKNSFIGKTENKSREINYNDYSKFYKEANNQAYPINIKAFNNINNFQNIHNINTINNNNFNNQNTFRYNDLNNQKNETNLSNISNEYNNGIFPNRSQRSFSETKRRSTPINENININTLQNNNRLPNGRPINYSNQNFYHGKNIINQENNNSNNFTNYQRPFISQNSPFQDLSNNIINNNSNNYNSSNNTIDNFYEQMQKEKKQKENYLEILRQQIEEKRKRKEMEKQKEKEYDLKLEMKYQEYLKQQKEMENKNNNNKNNNVEENNIKRPISNREKTINEIFNENNINSNIINSIQNNQQTLNNEKIKSRTNYNFNNNDINEDPKTRNKISTKSSSFLNSGKGIMDSFSQQVQTIDEFKNNLNINKNEFTLGNNTPNQKLIQNNNINSIKNDKFGFTFKNKIETEEMIDKIIKDADDFLQGTLQQSFNNKEEKEYMLYKMLNNGQNPNKRIEFQGTFGTNRINPNLDKTAQFNNEQNKRIQNIKNKENSNNNIRIVQSNKKVMNNNNKILLNNNINNNKKGESKNENKNGI